MRPVAGDVAASAERAGVHARGVLREGVPGQDVVVEHPVRVVHRVEVVGVEREQDPLAVGVVDRLAGEARVGVGDDDRADHVGPGVDRIEEGRRPLVVPPDGLGSLLDGQHLTAAADADAGVVVVGAPREVADQAGRVAVGGVVRLGVVGVALGVPAADVVGVAVAVVVEAAAWRARAQLPGGDLAVAEDGDQVLGRQVRRLGAADVHLVQVLVLPAVHTAAGRALLLAYERLLARGAGRVHPRVLRVVADVEVAVPVEVVGARGLAVAALRVRELALVQVDVVERVLDPVVRVVDSALDVGDQHVGPTEVPLRPGPRHVDPGCVLGIARVAGPAG